MNVSVKMALVAACCMSASALAGPTFIHNFDAAVGTAAGAADYAAGSAAQQSGPPGGPGGTIVSGGKFGNALDRSTGGRITYNTASNFNVQKGTVEMFIKYASTQGFAGVFGMASGANNAEGDIRMYLFASGGGGYGVGGYMTDSAGPPQRWETEGAVSAGLAATNTWHHIAWSWDLTLPTPTSAVYWDGILIRNTPSSGTVAPHPYAGTFAPTFNIGENGLGSATFTGLIDDFVIDNTNKYPAGSAAVGTQVFTPPTSPAAVPEPTTLVGIAGAGLLALRRSRRSK